MLCIIIIIESLTTQSQSLILISSRYNLQKKKCWKVNVCLAHTQGFKAGLAWSNASISWQDLDLVRPVGASECELQLNVPRQCWAGGFICSDRLLTVCDDERQLRVGAEHRFFSWQRELWRLEGARACISRPPLLLILPSKVLLLRPQMYLTMGSHAFQTPNWDAMEATDPSALLTPLLTSYISLAPTHNSSIDPDGLWLTERWKHK